MRRATTPIALFAYNRPRHTTRTLEALANNRLAHDSVLHVFADGPKPGASASEREAIARVREIARSRKWCGEVIVHERESNAGLAASIHAGVDAMLAGSDAVIVLEDDIETSPGFLEYMNDALRAYRDDATIMHISGYLPATSYRWTLPETFRARHMSCWGWATWADRWARARWNAAELLADLDRAPGGRARFDMDGTADFSSQLERNLSGSLSSWAVFWAASIYLAGGECLFPGRSLTRNIGTDGTGENFRADQTVEYDTVLTESVNVVRKTGEESRRGRMYLRSFFRYGRDSSVSKRARIALGRAKHRAAERLGRA